MLLKTRRSCVILELGRGGFMWKALPYNVGSRFGLKGAFVEGEMACFVFLMFL